MLLEWGVPKNQGWSLMKFNSAFVYPYTRVTHKRTRTWRADFVGMGVGK
jgi:hypothetical protein